MTLEVDLFRGDEDDDGILSAINTTPLVDVMMVLLIIFLITIPVVTHTIPVTLPHEAVQPSKSKPENIIIAVDKDGEVYWNDRRLSDYLVLVDRLKERAMENPQVVIRADQNVRYEVVGRAVAAAQRAGIGKVAFMTEPHHGPGSQSE